MLIRFQFDVIFVVFGETKQKKRAFHIRNTEKENNTMSSRKRSGSGSKRPKEKVVYIYEMIFRTDFKDPTKTNPEFWHEFFLLSPNVECLENEITKLSCEQLIALKANINSLFCRCTEMLDSGDLLLSSLCYLFGVCMLFCSLSYLLHFF